MAKKPVATTITPAAPAANVFATVGKFAFAKLTNLVIPEIALKPVRFAPVSPWKPFVDAYRSFEHNEAFFVPKSFFTTSEEEGGRGVEESKATPAYMKDKLRGAFANFKKKEPEAAKGRSIVLVERKAGEDDGQGGKYAEDGLTVWVQVTKAPASEPEAKPEGAPQT